MSAGVFLVIEGIDGAGTTTQTQRLGATLRARGEQVLETHEPSTGPVGLLLRRFLSGELRRGSRHQAERPGPDWETMALLFAADRLDHVASEIEPVLAQGGVVISDRYDASSLGYQSVSGALSTSEGKDGVPLDRQALAWIRELNRFARRPDLTIVVDVDAEVAKARRRARGGAEELYDADEMQRRLAEFYRELPAHLADAIVLVDGNGDADETERRVAEVVLPWLETRSR